MAYRRFGYEEFDMHQLKRALIIKFCTVIDIMNLCIDTSSHAQFLYLDFEHWITHEAFHHQRFWATCCFTEIHSHMTLRRKSSLTNVCI